MQIKQLSETINEYQLNNGLRVKVYHNENLTDYYANYTTFFGSNDLEYQYQNEYKKLPHGIAHFLEHVMFASKDGDVFNEFSKLAASANAYTSYNQTSYLFSCAENFKENMQTLITMVQSRYFTNEVVTKEMGIIEEEIKMYDVIPEWRLRNNTFESVCENTNYKIDIAGTVETINQITPQMLDEIFDIFYHPENQILVLSGNFIGIDIVKFLEEMQHEHIYRKKEVYQMKKNLETLNKNKEDHYKMEQNNLDRATFNYKFEVSTDPLENMRDYFAIDVFKKAYFSDVNPGFIAANEAKIINKSFQSGVIVNPDIKLLTFEFYDCDLLKTKNYINDTIDNVELDIELITLAYKKLLATEIRSIDNKTNLVELIISCELDNIAIDKYYDILYQVTPNEIIKRIKKLFNNSNKIYVVLEKPTNK